MKFVTIEFAGRERAAVIAGSGVDGEDVVLLDAADLVSVIEAGPAALVAVRNELATGERLPLASVELRAPLRRFRRDVLCTGWNYWDHFEESKGKRDGQDVDRPEHPTFFTRGPDVVIGPYDDIAYDPATLISELSFGMTFRPGDLLLTGTPAGIGNAPEPQVFLAEGDEVVTRADKIGELRNKLVYRELA